LKVEKFIFTQKFDNGEKVFTGFLLKTADAFLRLAINLRNKSFFGGKT
jgi:hypothetical protein